jgi:hypothetical protein
MRINVMRCDTVRGLQESLFKKLGHKVFVFDPYALADFKSPEKSVGFTLFPMINSYNLRIKT